MRRQYFLAIVLLALVIPQQGCVEGETVVDLTAVSTTTQPSSQQKGISVAQLLANARQHIDTEVTVYGRVRTGLAFEFVGEQPYQLEIGQARLWVITSEVAPADGAWITVRGTLKAPYQLKGRHYQMALIERERLP